MRTLMRTLMRTSTSTIRMLQSGCPGTFHLCKSSAQHHFSIIHEQQQLIQDMLPPEALTMHLFHIWLGCEGASLEVHEPTNDRFLQLTTGGRGFHAPPSRQARARAYTRGVFCARLLGPSYIKFI